MSNDTSFFTSINPSDAVQGGLIDDVDVAIKDLVWTLETPDGYTSREPVYGLKAYLSMASNPDEVVEQWWSAGTRKQHSPCNEERELLNEGHFLCGGPLIRGSNALEFLASLKEAGLKEEFLVHDLRRLVGIEMHVVRKTMKREGLAGAPREDGRAMQTLVCSKIHWAPGDKRLAKAKPAAGTSAASAGATAAAAKPRAAAAAAATSTATPVEVSTPTTTFDANLVAVEVLSDIMMSSPEAMAKGIAVAAAKLAANTALVQVHKASLVQRNKVMTLLFNPEWLTGQGVAMEESQGEGWLALIA